MGNGKLAQACSCACSVLLPDRRVRLIGLTALASTICMALDQTSSALCEAIGEGCMLTFAWPPDVSRCYREDAAWLRKDLEANSLASWVAQVLNDGTLAVVGAVLAVLKVAEDN